MRPVKGLNKDSDERSQPEGTYRSALNATLDEELGVLRREKGLEEAGVFTDETIQGHIILDSNTQTGSQTGNVILFLYNSSSGESRIVEWDVPNQTVTEHLNDGLAASGNPTGIDGSLDFDQSIQAVYRRLDTGDVVLYWTDGTRPPRFLNISDDTSDDLNAKDLDIFGKIESKIDFTLNDVKNFGGNLKGGTYQLAFAYVDDDGSVTNYFHISNPISITSRSGFGVDSEDKTSKSIEFNLEGVDTSYPYIRVAAIKGTNVEVLPDITITDSSLTYTFTGNENSVVGSIDDILIDEASYETAGVIQDHEGTLYLADLKKRDQIDFQKHANDVTLKAKTKPADDIVENFDPEDQTDAFKQPEFSTIGTFKRGETYAFYISYLLRDGSETPAFHIPGPGPTSGTGTTDDPYKADIIANTDLPSPSDAQASGNFNANQIVDKAAKSNAAVIEINDGSDVNATVSIDYLDPNGVILSNVNVSVSSSDTISEIVNDIVDRWNNDSTFSADFTAYASGGGTVFMEADAVGSQWNGYDMQVRVGGGIDYTNYNLGTFGGRDTQSDPTHEIIVDWDTGSTTVSVGTLTVPMTATNVADAYVTALNNDSTFSSNFTASHSNEEITITADQNGIDFNADVTVDDVTNGNELSSISLSGGYASGEDLPLKIKVYDGASYTDITGLTAGMAKNDVASQIQSELDSNGPTGFNYTVTDNVVTVEDTEDKSIEGQSIGVQTSFSLGVTTSSYSSGGSDAKKGESKITITGDAPTIPASPATGTAEVDPTPQDDGKEASGTLVEITSDASSNASFDAVVTDGGGNVVANVSVSVFDGNSDITIADRIVQSLSNNANLIADWDITASGGEITFTARNVGTQYNGYSLFLQNFSVSDPFFWNSLGNTTGGEDTGGEYGDFEIEIVYDNSNSNIVVTTTIDSGQTASQVAGEIVTALNNDSNFSNLYTASDNGDGTLTVTSDTNDSKYNGSINVDDLEATVIVDYSSIDGGNDGSEDIDVSVFPYSTADETKVQIPQGHSQNDIAFKIYDALVDNPSYTGNLTFTLNTNEITLIDESQTSSLNGDSPFIVDEYSIPHSTEDWSGGGQINGGGGGGGSFNEQISEISSGHPLESYKNEVSGTLRNFHVDAEKYQDGFSYWEQVGRDSDVAGEVYPDDERWDIVDENGDPKDPAESLRKRPVRHHRFPEINEERHLSEDINDPSNPSNVNLYGIQVQDVHVPNSIEDEVVGYKIYYAKKDPSERLVLDQSLAIRGWLDDGTKRLAQQRDNIFNDDVWCTWGWPSFTDFDGDNDGLGHDVDHNLLQFHPFESMRKGIGVQGVTHVKIVGFTQTGISDDKWNQFNPHSEIRNAKGVSYIEQNQRDVDLERFGFSHNFDNLLGESKLIIETDTDIDRDSVTAGSPDNMLCDICQLKTSVHRPFDNQELVSTGYVGSIDEDIDDNSAPNPPIIFGGDIHIEPWYFKAHTLLALADKTTVGSDDEENEFWNEDTEGDGRNLYEKKNDGEEYFTELKEILFGDNINIDEIRGLTRGMRDVIGDTSGIEHLPIAWGLMWWEIVETRDHPWFRIEGDGSLETFKPASSEFIANPDLGDIPQDIADISNDQERTYNETKWIFRFFKESDNWYGYNEEYSRVNITDATFPFRVSDDTPTQFPTRVVRSATINEEGERSAWRTFLQEDYIDLAQDRGKIIEIAPIGSNILIHTTEALFRTRADQRIKTTSQSAFVGSGDLFQPRPREVINLDEGYGGLLDHRASQVYENGYVFIDKEAGKVFIFNGEQPQEISNQGMRKFFRDNLTPSSEPRVGYDPHTGRIFISDNGNGWNYSFHPGLGAWISEHSFQSDYFFTTRDHLYTNQGDTVYRVSTGTPGIYEGNSKPFEIEYIQSSPRPEGQLVVSLIIDSRVLESGVVIPNDAFDQFQVKNTYQDTGLTNIRPKTDEDGSLRSNYNARLTDQAWKINRIRDNPSGPELTPSTQWKEKNRLSDNFHRVKLVYNADGRVIEIFSSALVTRASRR